MDERREKRMVQQAFENALSGLREDPNLAARVLYAAHREKAAAPRRRLSAALVFAVVLLLVCAGALAAVLAWQEYVPQMKQQEKETGDYALWPADRRIQLAADLAAMGYLVDSEEIALLEREGASEMEKAAAADRMMLRLTGLDDVREIHSTLITYAVMGHEDTWTPEQRVWWYGVVERESDTGAPDTPVIPTEKEISEEEAVAIAAKALQEAYGFDAAQMARLQPVANLYVTQERPNYRRWDVQFKQYREGSYYLEKSYAVIVDEKGEVISDPDVGIDHPALRAARRSAASELPDYAAVFTKYQETRGGRLPFWCWDYETKADYYAEMKPVVPLIKGQNTEIAYSVHYAYGKPGAEDVPYGEAAAQARSVLTEAYGFTDAQHAAYSRMYEAFDVTDPENAVWKFVFVDPDDYSAEMFRVILDGDTGEVLQHQAYEKRRMGESEEYDRLLY